jgi:hypothetical protein
MIDPTDLARLVARAQHLQRSCSGTCVEGILCRNCQLITSVVELANKVGEQILAAADAAKGVSKDQGGN